jgi:TRAP-type uncharacterized transport system fused permease subunit
MIIDLLTQKRLNLKNLVEGLTQGAIGGAKIGVTSAVIGFLLASMTMTGIGIKLAGMVAEWSGGIILIACIITMFVSILFGMGVPTMVAYALVALMVAPALMRMGVPLLQAHFFVMFFAVFSNLTPPVALACLVASGIAGGNYFKTAFIGLKIALIAFILPYLIIWNPAVILKGQNVFEEIMTVIAILLAMLAIGIVFTSYYITRINLIRRGLFAVGAILLLGYAFSMSLFYFAVGTALMIVLTLEQLRGRKKPD